MHVLSDFILLGLIGLIDGHVAIYVAQQFDGENFNKLDKQ